MPEITKVFAKGRMNKDLDERMVPNGEYRDALNLDLSVSEGSDVGAFENVKGNKEIIHKSYSGSTLTHSDWDANYISDLTNAACVGVISDSETEKIYWFIASDEVNAIAQYNQSTDVVTPLLVEKKTVSNFLNFTADNIITGINILKGILFWTDNKTEPKKIVIADWQNSTKTFLNHSVIYSRNFIESDITVIKKYPLTAPALELLKSKREGNIETTISYKFATLSSEGEYTSLNSESPEQTFRFSTKMDYKDGDVLIFELSNDNQEYSDDATVRVVITDVINPYQIKAEILSISDTVPTSYAPWKVSLLLEDPLFEFKFPRFAYRYKYNDNQYSAFSPFSEVGFLPKEEFEYDSKNGYNLAMVNNARVIKLTNFVPSEDILPKDVIAIDILYKETGNNAVYKVETFERNSEKWIANKYSIESELISSVVEANQILRPYDNVPKQAIAQEIVASRLIYGNYKQGYNMLSSQGQPFTAKFSFLINQNNSYFPAPSIKSQRTYQLGVVCADKYGRQSPVFTSDTAAKNLNKSFCEISSSISNKMIGDPPAWAKYFKYFIKENSSEYYNLAMDRWYNAEDGNIWLSFPSSDRDKITQESFIELKKQHTTSIPVTEPAKYKVVSISNNVPLFVKTVQKNKGVGEVDWSIGGTNLTEGFPLEGRLQFYIKNEQFQKYFAGVENINNRLTVTFTLGANKSDDFEIANIVYLSDRSDLNSIVQIVLEQPLDDTIAWTSTNNDYDSRVSDTLTVRIKEDIVENKPEFEGRFFVKIFKDEVLANKILNVSSDTNFAVIQSKELYRVKNDSEGAPHWWYFDETNPHDIEGVSADNEYHYENEGDVFEKHRVGWGLQEGYDKLDITWHGFGPNASRAFCDGNWDIWKYWDENNNERPQKKFSDSLKTIGTKFRLKGDPNQEVYEIKKIFRTYYTNANRNKIWCNGAGKEWPRRSIRYSLKLDKPLKWVPTITLNDTNSSGTIEILQDLNLLEEGDFSTSNPAIWETEPRENVDLDLYYAASDIYPISKWNELIKLNWSNCWAFGNGVESNRIRDDFAQTYLDNNPIVSTVLEEPYAEEHRSTGLIFSQIFNSQSGVNNLNQFILAEAITKDLNPRHGSIQKLHARDTDMITLCEDKCFYILANKDALFNADGSAQVTSNNAVLGLARPYAGDFGISTNPESFAAYGNRVYFTDKNRGVVIRLSGGLGGGDGITLISAKGMSDFFEDNLQLNTNLIGSYDTTSGSYNLVLNNLNSTLSYQESVDGWPTKLSFLKEQGVSINNKYYTFKEGRIWEHKANSLYNNFYGTQYDSQFTVLLNDSPTSVKNFKTLNYTGTEARDYKYETGNGVKYSLAEIQAGGLTPITETITPGWFVESINTDLQEGQLKTFLDKEGKYFNYIKGISTTLSNLDSKEFSVQGIGRAVVSGDEQDQFKLHVYVDDTCFVGEHKVRVYVDDTCYVDLNKFKVHVYVDDTCFASTYKVHVYVDGACYINN